MTACARTGTQELRARWERDRRVSRRLGVAVGTVTGVAIVVAALLWRLGPLATVLTMAFGALIWHVAVRAVETCDERIARADLPRGLRAWRPWAGTAIALAIFIGLGFPGIAGLPGLGPLLVLGGLAYVALVYARQAWELDRPRAFIEVSDDGRALAALQGTTLLETLEGAGYRLMTQCPRRGECASCRVRVRRGEQAWVEKHYGKVLTPRQRNEGWIVACQAPVERDLVIELYKPLVLRWPGVETTPSPTARAIRKALPGFDCEACGYPTCEEYARAVATGRASITRCHPGGGAVRARLKEIAAELKLSTGDD